MATSFGSAHGLERVRARAHEMREEVSLLAHADGVAYGHVLDALRASGDERHRQLDGAVSEAIAVPMRVLELASEVATLAADVAETGNRNLEGDALAGSLLAEAAARSAATLAQMNVSMLSRGLDRRCAAREAAPGAGAGHPRAGARGRGLRGHLGHRYFLNQARIRSARSTRRSGLAR